MALSKSQIKKIDKYKEQYYIIIPLSGTNVDALYKYFDNDASKFKFDKYYIYYIISNNEMKDVNKYIRQSSGIYQTVNRYTNKQEVFDDIEQEKIYYKPNLINRALQTKGMYEVKI